jgi:TPR repeat protein
MPELESVAVEVDCRNGDPRACTVLGQQTYSRSPQAAAPEAVALFSRACERDDPWACWLLLLEFQLSSGNEPVSVPTETLQRLRNQCEAGFVASCMVFGRTAAAAGDLELAREQFTRGCTGGDQQGCLGLFSLCMAGHEPGCRPVQPSQPLATNGAPTRI